MINELNKTLYTRTRTFLNGYVIMTWRNDNLTRAFKRNVFIGINEACNLFLRCNYLGILFKWNIFWCFIRRVRNKCIGIYLKSWCALIHPCRRGSDPLARSIFSSFSKSPYLRRLVLRWYFNGSQSNFMPLLLYFQCITDGEILIKSSDT